MQGEGVECRDRGDRREPPPSPGSPPIVATPPPLVATPPVVATPPPIVVGEAPPIAATPPPVVVGEASPIAAAPPAMAAPPIVVGEALFVVAPAWPPGMPPIVPPAPTLPVPPVVGPVAPPVASDDLAAWESSAEEDAEEDYDEPVETVSAGLRPLLAALLSAAFHLVAFIVLTLCVTGAVPRFRQAMLLSVSTEPGEDGAGPQEFVSPAVAASVDPMKVYSRFVGETSIPLPAIVERLVIDKPPPPEKTLPSAEQLSREAKQAEKVLRAGSMPAQPRLAEVANTQQALDRVLGEIGPRAGKQELLVVWLLDASLSLRVDRQQIATRIEGFFRQQEPLPEEKKHLLMGAVVAFGGTVVELEPPTRHGKKILDAIGRVPNDQTGVERTFTAVRWVVEHYAKRKGQTMIVLWTDESGDDQQELEPTIQACVNHKVLVSVVGPTSVLGRIYGRQSWPNSAGGPPLSLIVNRGPDSPAPERLLLPYWFDSRFPSWGEAGGGGFVDRFPGWYGGPQLESMLCGLGPYALVRLATVTGGMYTLLDRESDRGPFRLEVMRPYLPSYQSAKEYLGELRSHPLRLAVLNAAEATQNERNWPPPPLEFATPQAAALQDMFVLPQAYARRSLVVINRGLSAFGHNGMEKPYAAEKSPRWRAWYDLTRGRLLAGLVRYTQYEFLINAFQQRGTLAPATNRVLIVPSATIRGGSGLQAAAAEAERLLKRCMEKNPKTPWAYLAQRELDHAMGLDFQQAAVPPPPPRPPGPPGPARPKPSTPFAPSPRI